MGHLIKWIKSGVIFCVDSDVNSGFNVSLTPVLSFYQVTHCMTVLDLEQSSSSARLKEAGRWDHVTTVAWIVGQSDRRFHGNCQLQQLFLERPSHAVFKHKDTSSYSRWGIRYGQFKRQLETFLFAIKKLITSHPDCFLICA